LSLQALHSKRWRIAAPIPKEISRELDCYPPILRQVLYNRGQNTLAAAHRYLSADGLGTDPYLLTGMAAAVDRILRAVNHQEKLAVYGDYDVDGVTSTVLMTQVLRALGADVRPYIPNRFDEGYGLNKEALDALAQDGVKVVLTVDCGIRSLHEVDYGREIGLDMIVTDHHSPLGDIPIASAVICQRQVGDAYPDKNLAGVGLAYKLAQALLDAKPVDGVRAQDWLDLVALGTVADVVPLLDENRALVRAGLEQMRQGRRVGLFSLTQAAGLSAERCRAGDIAFGLGPRLNAAGRLESALAAVELLMAQDIMDSGKLAQQLCDQNTRRQEMTRDMQSRAESLIRGSEQEPILCVFDGEFNQGLVGLVAARLTENYYRPAIVGYQGEEFTRASCRSIDEFHVTQALDECADLLVRHGGHARAAGFTVRNENLPALIERMGTIAKRELAQLDLRPVMHADMEVPLVDLHPVILDDLAYVEPTGSGNPEVVFCSRNLHVVRCKTVGADKHHLRLTVSDGRVTFDGIAFRQGYWANAMPEAIDLLYTYERNYFNDRVFLQLNVRDLKQAGTPD
jgi:single-stranded-DNA-specific exonuclease